MTFLTVKESSSVSLAPRVVFGYCDLCGGGVRAIFGLQPSVGGSSQEWSVEVSSLNSCSVLPAETDRNSSGVLKVRTFYDSDGQPTLSAVALLAAVPAKDQVLITDAIISFIEEKVGADLQLTVLGALRLPEGCSHAKPYLYALNGAVLDSKWDTLPATTRVQDGLLAALVHLFLARELQATLVLLTGHRLSNLEDSHSKSHLQVVRSLGEAGAELLGCMFDETTSSAVQILTLLNWNDHPHDGIPVYT